jgi:adenosylhomocysteine nucleosidase
MKGRETWLVVAAEAREFAGVFRQARGIYPITFAAAAFAREIDWRGNRWILIANGPGPRLVESALAGVEAAGWNLDGVLSVGFCGALDPALRVGDIVVSGDVPPEARGLFAAGEILSVNYVVVSAEEKRRLRQESGARVVEMESSAVAGWARQRGLRYSCVKVVSDTAAEDLPLDFNRFRDEVGRFQPGRIAAASLLRPFTVLPALVRLDRNCRRAAGRLGESLAKGGY